MRNLYAGQEATVRTGHETTDWFQIGKGVRQGCVLSPCLFNLYAEYIMRNTGLEETQTGIKISWETDEETVETVTDFISWGSKITADGDCSHEIKRCLLLGRKVMTSLDSIFKSRDIANKGASSQGYAFSIVTYGCESWTIKKAERRRMDASELWHWRRKWQPTPVFLPGESQGQGSLAGCHLWGCTESDTTERLI